MVQGQDQEQDPQLQDPDQPQDSGPQDQDQDCYIREKQRIDIKYNAHYIII